MKQNKLFILSSIVALSLGGTCFTSCDDSEDYSISTEATVTEITTGQAQPTAISAIVSGKVLNLSNMSPARYVVGAVFGTDADLETNGTKTIGSIDANGTVTTTLTGLEEDKTYYYATYVTLQSKVSYMGEVKTFTTTDAAVATSNATSVSTCKAVLNGQTTGLEGAEKASTVGFRYALKADQVETGYVILADEVTANFSTKLKGLLPGTTYYYAAFSQMDKNYLLGEVKSFTTATQEMEYVDLGLSVLWAKYNVGAEKEEEFGAHGGFGDQTFYERAVSVSQYTPWDLVDDEDMVAGLNLDGSNAIKSRMPSIAKFQELIDNTTQEADTVNGVEGVRFSAPDGQSVFFPLAGYRDGEELTKGAGFYWTSQVSPTNENYAKNLLLDNTGKASIENSLLYHALSVRTVRPVEGIYVNNRRLKYGDLEGNGNFRIDIYNEWDGSGACGETSPINKDEVVFTKNLAVTIQLSGISVPGTYNCYMVFADGTWATQNWGYQESGNASCTVTGDGIYKLVIEGAGSGLGIFAIDVAGLSSACGGADGITAKILKLEADI